MWHIHPETWQVDKKPCIWTCLSIRISNGIGIITWRGKEDGKGLKCPTWFSCLVLVMFQQLKKQKWSSYTKLGSSGSPTNNQGKHKPNLPKNTMSCLPAGKKQFKLGYPIFGEDKQQPKHSPTAAWGGTCWEKHFGYHLVEVRGVSLVLPNCYATWIICRFLDTC